MCAAVQAHHLVYLVDQQSEHPVSGGRYENAVGWAGFSLSHAEAQSQVDDGKHLAPDIDDAADRKRRVGDSSDRSDSQDFLDDCFSWPAA